MANNTARFFSVADTGTKSEILSAIARRYGITPAEAENEVTAPDAENLLDYLTGATRTATGVLMRQHRRRLSAMRDLHNRRKIEDCLGSLRRALGALHEARVDAGLLHPLPQMLSDDITLAISRTSDCAAAAETLAKTIR